MALKDNVIEGKVVARLAPFANLKGFAEREDKTFQDDGYTTNGTDGTTLLYDVRAMYGFFLWLQNLTGESVNFTVFYSYKNFTDVKTLTEDDDWVIALDSTATPITGAIANGVDKEVEFVRATSRVTALRVDIDSTTAQILNGVFSAI